MKRPLLWSAVLGLTSSMLVTLGLGTAPAQAAVNPVFTETFSNSLSQWDQVEGNTTAVIQNGRLTTSADGEALLRSKFSAVHDVARFDVYAGRPGAAVKLFLNANDWHTGNGITLVSASSPAGGSDTGAFNHLQMGMSFPYPGMTVPVTSAATVTLARNYISDFYMSIDPHAPGEPTVTYPLGLANSADTSGTKISVAVRNGAAIDNVTMGTRDVANVSWTAAAANGSQLNVGSSINAISVPSDTLYTLSSSTPDTCSVNNTVVTGLAMGTCRLYLSTSGNHVYKAAPAISTDLKIRPTSPVPSTVDVQWGEGSAEVGLLGPVDFVVRASDNRYAEFEGEVRLQINDGTPVVRQLNNNRVSFDLPNQAGRQNLVATYVPANNQWALGSTHTSHLEVAKAATIVRTEWTSEGLQLSALHEQTGTSVAGTFEVTLNGETRTFTSTGSPVVVPFGVHRAGSSIAIEFSGNADYRPSSKVVVLSSPTLSATADRDATNGWYRAPVTWTFSCDGGGSSLPNGCLEPVTMSEEGHDQSVPGTITTADGVSAAATAVASIDLTAPEIALHGVTDGAIYPTLPEFTCTVTDELSGPDGCDTTSTELGQGKIQVTATGHDLAGNTATASVTITVKAPELPGAPENPGTPSVPAPTPPVVVGPVTVTPGSGAPKVTKTGTTVRIVRTAKKRTTVVLTVKSRKRPTTLKLARNVKGIKIAKAKLVKKGKSGVRTWRITITMTPKATKRFNLKMRVNGKIRVLKLLIVR